jgi:hypothetical protein
MRDTVSPDHLDFFLRVNGGRSSSFIFRKNEDAMLVQKARRPVGVSREEDKKRYVEDDESEKLGGRAGRKAEVVVVMRRFHADWIQHAVSVENEIVPVRNVENVDGREGVDNELVDLLNHLMLFI